MTDDYATYDDIMADLANDRDDSYDPEFRDPEGYCPHGQYVGGSGADLMCEWCESGISVSEARRIIGMERLRAVRRRAEDAQQTLNRLLKFRHVDDKGKVHVIGGGDAAFLAQKTSYIANPLTRYGRH
jgi:hypothetical protein